MNWLLGVIAILVILLVGLVVWGLHIASKDDLHG